MFNDPKTLRKYLATVRRRAADLVRIVSELTEFTELVRGEDTNMQRSSARGGPDLIDELAAGRPMHAELSAEAAGVQVDLNRLHLILSQVIDNAFKFGRPGSEVLVRAAVDGPGKRLIVRVTNAGPSIPESQRAVIFEPYRQAEAMDTRHHGGLGLGLTVARRAAEGAGGALILEAGEPTTFRVELPQREDPIAREARELEERARRMDAQALRAVKDLRTLRTTAQQQSRARELAERQQLRAIHDFRIAHDRARDLAERLESAYLETISALARAVEARDNYTGRHVERVRDHSRRIGEACGLAAPTLRQLEFGALLHDVGKIGVPDSILHKSGPLDVNEWVFMRRHPEVGRLVLDGVAFLSEALDAVGCHHERWDGSGYPAGLAGADIPLFGRIVAVADAFDAMVTDRPYRLGLPIEAAFAELERGRGHQFDPDIVKMFLTDPPTSNG